MADLRPLFGRRAPPARDFTNRRCGHHGQIDEIEKAKNLHRLEVTAALANLYLVRRRLLATQGTCR